MVSYIKKKSNLDNFILNKILWDELNQFHKKSIKESDGDNLFTKRLVYWKQQANKELKIIGSNPTRDLVRTRINNLKEIKDCTPVILDAIVSYIKAEFEHIMKLGHSEAFVYLCDLPKEAKTIKPKHYETFKYKGDLEVFYNNCLEYNVINNKTSLDSFKIAYNGTETSKTSIIKLTCAKTTFTCFMTLLNDAGMFENYPKNFHKVGEAITGETDFKNALAKYKTTGTFENEDKFKHLVKTLSQNL